MLESYESVENQVPLYDASDFPFNFAFVEMYAPVTASKVAKELNDWLNFLPEGKVANWVVSSFVSVADTWSRVKYQRFWKILLPQKRERKHAVAIFQ